MSRKTLLSTAALGAVASLLGTAVFTASTDRATAGPTQVDSQAQPVSADLKIADYNEGQPYSYPASTELCGQFTDSREGLPNIQPGNDAYVMQSVCLRNDGSAPVNVTLQAIDVTDSELDCTGDEAEVDTTCGLDAAQQPQAGELTDHLRITVKELRGETATWPADRVAFKGTVVDLTPADPGPLAPGETRLYELFAVVPHGSVFTDGQSDRAVWTWAFDAARATS